MVNGILFITVYAVVSIFSYWLIKNDYKIYARKREDYRNPRKLRLSAMIIISLLFTWVNWFATSMLGHNELGGDRLNYSVEFLGARSVQSQGLQFVFDIVKLLGGDIYTVFYVTTFITIFIVLIAYRRSKLAGPKVIALLLVSEYVIFTFTALKQCYAAAFCFLFFVNAMENDTKKGKVLCLIDIVLAVLFHSSGFILIPLFVILKGKKDNPRKYYFLVFAAIVSIIFLPTIMQLVARVFGAVLPILSFKIDKYFGDMTSGLDSQWTAVIKYIPFFYIGVWGAFNRKRFRKSVPSYDKYLTITIIAVLIVFYSLFSYWFERFRYQFYFPVYMFYQFIDENESNRNNRMINNTIVLGGTLYITMRKILLIFINFGIF